MDNRFDVIIVGTGFAGAFFLMRYLEHAPTTARVLVLERGNSDPKAWQLANRKTSSIDPDQVFVSDTPDKEWLTSPGFGGNSKCWWGGATRMMPGDFKLKSRYGVGYDWPISYEDLEAHYGVVEQAMMISGPLDSPMPRSRPFPLPPHIFSDPDSLLKKRFPSGWYQPATARASAATGTRGICCATGYCELCPVDAKFTIQNGLHSIYQDPRVTLLLDSAVDGVETAGGIAKSVVYTRANRSNRADGDVIVLATSALFNPHILLRSNINHPLLGKRLHEQMPVDVCMNLKGVKGYNGSTAISGNGYLFYEGEHRRDYAACLLESWNSPFSYGRASLRAEEGRWTERAYIRFMFDDIPRDDNTVTVHKEDPRLAETRFIGYSDYANRGRAQIPKMIDKLAEALPIESVESISLGRTTAHIQGTVVMGADPAGSIVDRYLVHHQVRNLLVLGASAYPTASPSYPTVTISALSLWAADHYFAPRAA
ncbi:MAG: GMC family oxidoreductase [Gammaproteobacteria bacterium]|nr:GMC family oxidoreductase [Gammaproteobacteria bacterium]